MSERAIVLSEAKKRGANERLAFSRREEETQARMQNVRTMCGHLRLSPCGDDGARDGTCKERSDGIAIVARRADRVSHREESPSRQRETPDFCRELRWCSRRDL